MKFLVDEQLPEKLVLWLMEQGYDAVHATSLGTGVRISDDLIAVRSMH
jgi:predicted nuclease of predicted toxin-antitoxin system